ncbi:MAG: hypothetical protein ACREEP_18810, partial [Dongiaceae bacterium]
MTQVITLAANAMSKSSYDSDRIWRDDKAHFVHPFTHFDSFKKDGSLVITGALPGTPASKQTVSEIIAQAAREAAIYRDGGVD